MNSTGVMTEPLQGATDTTMANMTTDSDQAPSSSGSASSPSPSAGSAASMVKAAEWGLAAVAGAAGLALF